MQRERGLIVSVANSDDNIARDSVVGIYLLFADGQRPDRHTIHKFAEANSSTTLTLDPAQRPTLRVVDDDDTAALIAAAQAEVESSGSGWVELLRNGLTFDLEGLAPGDGFEAPATANFFDCPANFDLETASAIRLVAGSHLAGSEGSLPVLRSLLALARDLVQHFDQISMAIWPPSASAIGRRFFESTTTAWLDGGAFPALGLTAFKESIDGGLESVGLEFLIGQELRIEPALARDKVAATRLGVRLINQLVLTGRVLQSEQIIAPDGQKLRIAPSQNGRYARLWSS